MMHTRHVIMTSQLPIRKNKNSCPASNSTIRHLSRPWSHQAQDLTDVPHTLARVCGRRRVDALPNITYAEMPMQDPRHTRVQQHTLSGTSSEYGTLPGQPITSGLRTRTCNTTLSVFEHVWIEGDDSAAEKIIGLFPCVDK